MIIFLSKFLPLFIYPTGLMTILLIATLVFWKRTRLAKILLSLSLIILLVAGNKYVSQSLTRSLEWRYPTLPSDIKGDVIVILSGGTEPAAAPRIMIEGNTAMDRVLYGLKLYKEGAAPAILLTGGNIYFHDDSPSTPADDMATLLESLGVPREALIIENQSQNTEENAEFSCRIIRECGFQSVILVTSALHMPRSVKLFESQGCPVIPAPADFSITEESWQRTWHPTLEDFFLNLLPSYSHLSSFTQTLKEYIGMLYYKVNGVY